MVSKPKLFSPLVSPWSNRFPLCFARHNFELEIEDASTAVIGPLPAYYPGKINNHFRRLCFSKTSDDSVMPLVSRIEAFSSMFSSVVSKWYAKD